MYLKSLQIERFRAFRHMTVSFRYPEAATSGKLKYPNINLLLGNNGMGKSAALKAAALALMSPVLASTGYRPYSLVRREVDKSPVDAAVRAHVALSDQDLEEDFDTAPDAAELRARISRRHTTETCEFDSTAAHPVWEPMFREDSAAFFSSATASPAPSRVPPRWIRASVGAFGTFVTNGSPACSRNRLR